jgi:DNA-binding LacI/PurR family transcriptional regulator
MNTSITMKEVAQRAGVSPATVSRVVNANGSISAKTTQRVRTAIEELGFRPNVIGRNLKSARTWTFGILLPSLSNPIFGEVLEGIQKAALSAGYSALITCSNYREDEERNAIETMLANRVDGLILTVADADHSAQLDRLDAQGVPYVLLFNQPKATNRSAVTVENRAAGRLIAEEFIQLGHTRMGMIAGRFDASDRSRLRFRGFEDGIAAAGLAPPALVEVDFVEGRISRAVGKLLHREEAPTALFCSTDLLALSVICALRALEIAVPNEISVIGFDGISFGLLSHPSLATVVQPSHAMGQSAVQHLLGRLTGGKAPSVQVLAANYRPGTSTGPPPLAGVPTSKLPKSL